MRRPHGPFGNVGGPAQGRATFNNLAARPADSCAYPP
jgi:hypothetical protein